MVLSRARCIFVIAALILSCGDDSPAPRERDEPNLLIVSIDTLRRDHVTPYGYTRDTTPNLAKLAAEGVVFEDAVSTTNWTLPAHMSLFTGLPPAAHGVEDDRGRLADEIVPLGEVLTDAGYTTAAITSHVYTDAKFGFGRGMDHFDTQPGRHAEDTVDRALDWLADNESKLFFLFVHVFDPHWDFAPPDGFADRFGQADPAHGKLRTLFPYFMPSRTMDPKLKHDAIALYDAEIAYTDHQLGRLFDQLRRRDLLDDTVVLVVSDHGEEFGEHGTFGHGTHLHAEVSRIPFIARFPSVLKPGRYRAGPVWLADVPRFALDLVGIEPPEQFTRFAADLRQPELPERTIVAESTRWGPRRLAVYAGDQALHTSGSYQPLSFSRGEDGQLKPTLLDPVPLVPHLYDRASDPEEMKDLWGDEAHEASWPQAQAWLDRFGGAARLRCELDPTRETTVLLGAEEPWPDEPFFLDPIRAVIARNGDRGMAAYLPAGNVPITLGLAFADGLEMATAKITRGGDALYDGMLLVDDPAQLGPCAYSPAGRVTGDAPSLELSPEERATLDALGYIE